jgi:subfamily B ATP-binding cassette protein MsbA
LRTYLRLARFAAPYKLRILAAVLCMAVLALTTAAYANLLGPALEFLFTGQVKALASLRNFVPASVDLDGSLATLDRGVVLAALPFVIVGVAIVKGLATYGQFYLMGMVSQRTVADLRRGLFDKMLSFSPAYFTHRSSGDLLARVAGDVWAVDAAVTNAIPSYVRDGLTLVIMLVNCFILDWRMSLVVFAGVPLTLWPVLQLTKRLKTLTSKAAADTGYLTSMIQEALAGVRVIQAFGMEKWEAGRFAEAVQKYLRVMRRSFRVRAVSSPLMEIMGAAGIAAAIWWVGARILAGEMQPGKFFTFIAAVMLLYQPPSPASPRPSACSRCSTPRARSRIGAPASCRRSATRSASSRWGSRTTRAGRRCSVTSISRSGPARWWRSWEAPAAARRRSRTSSRGSGTRAPAGSPSMAWISATPPSRACGRRSPS